MLESIRARLLLWYTLVLVILIAVYAGTVTYFYQQSLLTAVDEALQATSASLVDTVTADSPTTFELALPAQLRQTAFGEEAEGTYYVVWDSLGELVDRSDMAPDFASIPPRGLWTRDGRREWLVEGPGQSQILVGRPLASTRAAVQSLGLLIAAAGGLVLLLSFAGGFFLAGRALAPVARISATAGAMVGGELKARIPVESTDSELEQVARALNEAFDRLQRAAEQQRQFTADASHEFRTPLATLRAELEWALGRPRSPEEYRTTIAKSQQAVLRLSDIADRLLTTARHEHAASTTYEVVDMRTLVGNCVDMLRPLAAERGVTIKATLQPAHLQGNASRLEDVVANLLKNAIEYNHPGGHVEVSLTQDGAAIVATVRDTGIGISASDLPRIFDRFYRAEQSRSRERGGAGLGLAIVKDVVAKHGGTVTCASVPGEGSTFTVRLPAVAIRA